MSSVQKLQACAGRPLYSGQAEGYTLWSCGGQRLLWVGLSGKPEQEQPLAQHTLSGSLVAKIEQAAGITGCKMNLVRCAPIDDKGKLRYPTKEEMSACAKLFAADIRTMQPKAVVLLGERAGEATGQALGVPVRKWDGYYHHPVCHNGTWFAMVQHPSYIGVYKKKEDEAYCQAVAGMIRRLAR